MTTDEEVWADMTDAQRWAYVRRLEDVVADMARDQNESAREALRSEMVVQAVSENERLRTALEGITHWWMDKDNADRWRPDIMAMAVLHDVEPFEGRNLLRRAFGMRP